MTPENFCYWLKGFMEIQKPETITPMQITVINDHLNLVFNKVTPDRDFGDDNPFLVKFIQPCGSC